MEHAKEGGSRTLYELGGREGLGGREVAAESFPPRYVFTPRLVGRLSCGELAVEPVLGVVRVAGVRQPEEEDQDGSFVHVTWRDEQGPGTATGRYPADRSFEVRMPDLADRLLVRRGIDQARWRNREITDDVARLIASHLHSGERSTSTLHAFTIDGSIDEGLYDELDVVAGHRLYAREWVDALVRYCLARKNPGPVLAWTRAATNEAEARAEEWLTAGGVNARELEEQINGNGNNSVNGNGAGGDGRKRYPGLLSRKHIQTEMAARLIEAAFKLGVEAGRSRTTSSGARFLIRQQEISRAA
jgi:hypothetical protein